MRAAITAAMALVFSASCNSPSDLRLHCLRMAHKVVKVNEQRPETHEVMVREYYLRCLEAEGVSDVEVGP